MSKLGDHIEYVKGFAFKSKDYTETGIPVIRVSNFTDNSIDIKDVYHIPKERFSEFQKVNLIKDDIVIATVGSWPTNPSSVVGKTIRVPPEANNTLLNQNAVRIRSLDKDEQLYFYYVLKDKSFSDYIISTAQGSANQASITLKSILDYDLPNIDSKEKRIKIGKTLATYDEKIQLNTQINQTLEQIAQALFKSWFVDFDPVRAKVQALSDGLNLEQAELTAIQAISGKTPEELTALSQTQPDRYAELVETAKAFPYEMVEVDGVEVPKGWEYKSVGDFINVVDYVANGSFATLKENVTLLTEPDYAIYIRTTDFNSGFSKELRYVDKSAYDFLAKSVLIGNEVIISNVGDVGTVFRSPSWLGMPMTLGSNAIALKNYDIPHYLYLYFSSHKGQHDISSIVTGSAQLKFNKTNFRSLKVLMPNNSLLTKFEKFILPIFEKIDANMAENLKLAEIRDLLLPRLLSGDFL